ncbi:type II toxin-antitoxin system Phd/YefM family antitoxin [Rhodococcus sp. NPDC058514]|uniref:type II toxin-antitoxin system Phd/YefM family antitoxin n=1 Tax=unclassified Rhodococcus (in: high G+C Gram-positive bacteria) TaxID=192944 RepID=UPI00364F91CD
MTTVPATQARQQWAATLDLARRGPVTITQHGRPGVVLMDADTARRALEALHDAEDAAAADAAREAMEAGEPTVSLDEIARELGLSIG